MELAFYQKYSYAAVKRKIRGGGNVPGYGRKVYKNTVSILLLSGS